MSFKKILSFFILIGITLGVWGAARFSHHQTRGFRLAKIAHNTSSIAHEHYPAPQELLNQKFHFFGRGLQSFSFLSEDKAHVLKIFNNRYQNRLFWLKKIPSFGPLENWKKGEIAYNALKCEKAFASYTIAFTRLREEAGLIAYHPNQCTTCPSVTLVDPLGIEHQISLRNYAFVLQKKGELPYPYIDKAMKEGEVEKAKEAIFSLITLMKLKMDRGIADADPLVRANFGFCEGKAMQIDIGPFSFDQSLKEKRRQKEEALKMTLGFKHWLENHHPDLIETLHEALENF